MTRSIIDFTNLDADMLAEKYNMRLSYDEKADADLWAKLQTFLHRVFK